LLDSEGFKSGFGRAKLVMSSHVAPAALQGVVALREPWLAVLACGLLVSILCSSDFRCTWRTVEIFRWSVTINSTIQVAAFLCSALSLQLWPSAVGVGIATLLGVCGLYWEPKVAREQGSGAQNTHTGRDT
jgi:hypothetical protein